MTKNSFGFKPDHWLKAIKKPDWYREFIPWYQQKEKSLEGNTEQVKELRYLVRHFFEMALLDGKVALAGSGPDLDLQRLPVDTIVIHHTSNQPGYKLSYMNAVHLLNIYAPYFMNPTVREERDLKSTAIWSGHIKDGKPSFLAYHWFMRMDGSFERLLEDEELGWHAGNWEINKRSIGICLDNNYENKDPIDDILRKLATHIKKHYKAVNPQNIIGHSEARDGTTCPGKNFIPVWKKTLLKYVSYGS